MIRLLDPKAAARQLLAVGDHTITVADPLPSDLRQTLETITAS